VPKEGASGKLIKEFGLGEVTGVDNTQAIADTLERMLGAALRGGPIVERKKGTEKFNRQRLAGELSGILQRVVRQDARKLMAERVE
jgi:hypothetical protein